MPHPNRDFCGVSDAPITEAAARSPEPGSLDGADGGDDAALIARIAKADREAFAALFRRWAGKVKGFLIRSGVGHAEADEAAQEVMLSVWRRADSFDPARAGAATWIYAIARNRRVDLLRRRRPEPDPDDPLFAPEPEPPADAAAAREGRDAQVRAALEALPADQALVVRLAFYDGLSHAEVAAMIDAPLGTVKSRLRLAMGKIRAALGDGFAEELLDD
jgi:RNA polymerase sigma-70 factor (ECF subfamily)